MKIRQETPNDYDEIYKLIQTAFQSAKVKDGTEQDYAVKLRNSDNYVNALALVAEDTQRLIGHIMLTRISLIAPEKSVKSLMAAPLSVLESFRGKGVGGKLMKTALSLAENLGYDAVFLCGDPEYYKRFGYQEITNFGIKNASQIPTQYVMGIELRPGALTGCGGQINFPE